MTNMKRKKHIKAALTAVLALVLIVILVIAAAFAALDIRTKKLEDDAFSAAQGEKYKTKVSVEGVDIITQKISCGYAVIEMFSAWNGGNVTEEAMFEEYGKVVTSTGKSFCAEFNKQNPDFQTTMYKYCTDSELIDKIYDSLSSGIPVPIELAAKYQGQWTLHYSLVIGMNLADDTVIVANPYGCMETLSVGAFLSRTRFSAFEDMPLLYRLAFAFGVFEKNTVFIPVQK